MTTNWGLPCPLWACPEEKASSLVASGGKCLASSLCLPALWLLPCLSVSVSASPSLSSSTQSHWIRAHPMSSSLPMALQKPYFQIRPSSQAPWVRMRTNPGRTGLPSPTHGPDPRGCLSLYFGLLLAVMSNCSKEEPAADYLHEKMGKLGPAEGDC